MVQSPTTWSRCFTFRGKDFFYNRIPFNNRAERAVEVPLAFDFLARQQSQGKIMEVGNVLQYYENALSDVLCLRTRRIVDKFEVGYGIDNVDIMDVDPEDKYHSIVCISTLEHVGQSCSPTGSFGEQKKVTDFEAPLKAIAKVYDLLAVGGKAFITVPFGRLIDGGWYIQFNLDYLQLLTTSYGIPQHAINTGFLKHVATESVLNNPHQHWLETSASDQELSCAGYDNMLSGAHAIAVIELVKQPDAFTLTLDLPPTPLIYERSQLAKSLFVTMGLLRRWVMIK